VVVAVVEIAEEWDAESDAVAEAKMPKGNWRDCLTLSSFCPYRKGDFTMTHTIFRSLLFSSILILILGILTSCNTGSEALLPDDAIEIMEVAGGGNTFSAPGQTPEDDLSNIEKAGLLFMREEEKLARDTYLTLYDKWSVNTFQNISRSEQNHMDAVKTLLDLYGLEDPVGNNGIGVFTDPALQELHDKLVAEGKQSLSSALRVGAAIEEIDILDLEERIAQTDKADIQEIYENLTRGSQNHLRAFTSVLERQTGETYEPQYLSQEVYDSIINASTERGVGWGRRNRGGR
jgi:hypothetical protein